MAEYIDKVAATTIPTPPKENRVYQTYNLDDVFDAGWHEAQRCISNLPTADVRENVKGEWKQVEDHDWAGKGKTVCSKCHYGYSWRMYFEVERFKYCPNCGAKMEVQDG